jgi:SAM-dependent methyltransferase
MTGETEQEAARVRAAYARRAELGLDGRYAYWQPDNLFIYQSRERALLAALHDASLLPLTGHKVLDAGCGDGSVLWQLLRYGARLEDLLGVDLLQDRVETAKAQLPGADIRAGDVQMLPYADASFDLVLAFTLLTSVTGAAARGRVRAELLRVTRPGGLILVYDFWINPFNRHTRSVRRRELRELFAGYAIRFRGLTLAPPLLRPLIRLPGGWLACTLLEVIPLLRTHYLAAIQR